MGIIVNNGSHMIQNLPFEISYLNSSTNAPLNKLHILPYLQNLNINS